MHKETEEEQEHNKEKFKMKYLYIILVAILFFVMLLADILTKQDYSHYTSALFGALIASISLSKQ